MTGDGEILIEKSQHRLDAHAFSASRFPEDPKAFPSLNLKVYMADKLFFRSARDLQRYAQVFRPHHCAHTFTSFGSRTSLSASPIRLKADTRITIATPGTIIWVGLLVRTFFASFNIAPHSGVGA